MHSSTSYCLLASLGLALFPVGCGNDSALSSSQGSDLVVVSPVPGAVVEADVILLEGFQAELVSLTLAGESTQANPAEGDFEVLVPARRGIQTFTVEGRGKDGVQHLDVRSVLAGSFHDADEVVTEAAGLFLGPVGLQRVGEKMMEDLTPAEVSEALRAENPIYQDTVQMDWLEIDVELRVDAVQFDATQVRVQPREGRLDLSVGLGSLEVDVRIVGSMFGWIEDDLEGRVYASFAELELSVSPGLSDTGISLTPLYGGVSLEGFGFDIQGVSDFLENLLAEGGGMRADLETALYSEVSAVLLPRMEALLSDFEVSDNVSLLDADLAVELSVGRVEVDSRGLTLCTDIGLGLAEESSVGLGYFAGPQSTLVATQSHIGELLLSDNFLNLALLQLWKGGAFDSGFSTSDGTLDPLFPLFFQADEADLRLVARLPPVVMEQEGGLTLSFGELEMELLTPGAELGERAMVVLQGFGTVRMDLERGSLTLSADSPEVTVFVRENDWGMSAADATLALQEVLPMGLLVERFRSVEIPMPTLAVLGEGDLSLVRTGEGNQTAVVLGR